VGARIGDEPCVSISRNAQVGGVPKRHHPAQTDQDVQAHGKQRVDQDLTGQVDVKIVADHRWQSDEEKRYNEQREKGPH